MSQLSYQRCDTLGHSFTCLRPNCSRGGDVTNLHYNWGSCETLFEDVIKNVTAALYQISIFLDNLLVVVELLEQQMDSLK